MKKLPNEVFQAYDDYAHNRIDRKSFMERLSFYAVGGLTVPGLMSFLMPNYQDKIQIKGDDPRLDCRTIEYDSPSGGGKISGLLCKPKGIKAKFGAIVVVHENRGLNPHIEDIARRAALAGFIALAPDALSPLGGYPGNDDDGRELQSKRNRDEMLEDFKSAYVYLSEHPDCNSKVGVVGFCFGGWISNMMAVQIPQLAAAVPFYGGQAPVDQVPSIQAPLQLHFADLDTRVNEGWPAYEQALKTNGKTYEVHFYENANHGFHNDTTPRFDPQNAKLAWSRTIEFFKKHLR